MSDLRWDDVKEWFDPAQNGTVPDVVVADTTLDDWQALITLIRTAGWQAEYEHRDRRGEVPPAAADLFVIDPDGWLKYLRVWPDSDMEMIFRPWSTDDIVGDVSLFELQGQERLDVFCGVLRQIGQALGKRVAMFAEGDGNYPPMLAYEIDLNRVVFLGGKSRVSEFRALSVPGLPVDRGDVARSWVPGLHHLADPAHAAGQHDEQTDRGDP